MSDKKLYRTTEGKVFAGVCSGLGEYFGIDPVIVRLVWVILICCCGIGLVAYLLAWLIIPKKPIITAE